MDSPLEEGGFEPSVPAGDQRGPLGSRLQKQELRSHQEYFSHGEDKINKTIPGIGGAARKSISALASNGCPEVLENRRYTKSGLKVIVSFVIAPCRSIACKQ
jgi:hypothetical protein